MSNVLEKTVQEDPKRARVMDRAMELVLAYGYHRTTMDDIARAAEMSRPALYLLFRNKADIYRAIASRIFNQAAATMESILEGKGSLGERLAAAIEFKMIDMMCPMRDSRHGAEIMDLRSELAGDLVEGWHRSLAEMFRQAIAAEVARTGVDLKQRGLCAEVLAELLVDGLEGMAMRSDDAQTLRLTARQLVRVIELAIEP